MTLFNTCFDIALKGHGTIKPTVRYGINETVINNITLSDQDTILSLNLDLAEGCQKFYIEFYGKDDSMQDTAVEIKSVSFENLTLDRFKWSSKYYPVYPQPWASQQKDPLPEFQSSATYMGWNGRWVLEFETPIFTWIHKLENLGWIFP